MPTAIKDEVKTNVIRQWLNGDGRDKIANDNQIGAGTVTGIINEFKKDVDVLEYQSVRELSISCKKQDEIESFIGNLANFPDPKKLFDVANQIVQISMSESISLEELGNRVKQKEKEKQMLEEEIKQRRAILKSKNIDIQTLNEYKKLKEGLYVHGLSLKDPRILLSILKTALSHD